VTERGPRHMALFTSPRVPGSHFKVELDAGTATRLRAVINTEQLTAQMTDKMAEQLFGSHSPDDEEEEPLHDPFGRN